MIHIKELGRPSKILLILFKNTKNHLLVIELVIFLKLTSRFLFLDNNQYNQIKVVQAELNPQSALLEGGEL